MYDKLTELATQGKYSSNYEVIKLLTININIIEKNYTNISTYYSLSDSSSL